MRYQVFPYLKTKVRNVFEASNWHDDVGQKFESEAIPRMEDSLKIMIYAEEELLQVLDCLDKEIRS